MGPHAVLLCGPAASGKSVVGRELARLLGWPLLDLDTVTAALYELSGGEEAALLPSSSGVPHSTPARYASLFDTARENLDLGVSLVLVAPFTLEQASAPAWAAACAALGVAEDHVQLVWVDTPAEVAAERMRRRAATRDEGRIASLDATPQSPVPVAAPVVPHLVSDGLVPPSLQARRIAAALSAPHPA